MGILGGWVFMAYVISGAGGNYRNVEHCVKNISTRIQPCFRIASFTGGLSCGSYFRTDKTGFSTKSISQVGIDLIT